MQQRAQAQREREEKKTQEMKAASDECRREWDADRRIDPIRNKIPLDVREATLTQRNNTERVSAAEKPAIEAVDEIAQHCGKKAAEILSRYITPQHMALLYRAQSESRARRADLWGGRITYGEAISKSEEALRKLLSDDAALTAQINQQAAALQAQQAQAEAARQQASSAAMAQTLQGLYMMNQASQPRYVQPVPTNTTCNRSGQNINCTTW
jgi:hypothetical protein